MANFQPINYSIEKETKPGRGLAKLPSEMQVLICAEFLSLELNRNSSLAVFC